MTSSQTKVTNLDVTGRVEENILGLKITMDHPLIKVKTLFELVGVLLAYLSMNMSQALHYLPEQQPLVVMVK